MDRAAGIPNTTRVARAAATRSWIVATIRAIGLALTVAMSAALVLVALDRAVGPIAPLWLLMAVPSALGVVAGVIFGAARALGPARALVRVDDRLGLHDALSSAVALTASHEQDRAFADLAAADAERIASDVRVGQVMPIRPGGGWLIWPVVGALSVLIGLYVPRLEPRTPDVVEGEDRAAHIEKVTDQIADARQAVQQALEGGDGDAASLEELTTLEELERELTGEDSDPDEIASRAAEELERIADGLQQESEQTARHADELSRQLAEAAPEAEGPAADLADALADGDLAEARDAARRLEEQIETLDEAQREALARELAQLADQLAAAEEPEPPMDPRLNEDLRQQGLSDESLDQLAEQTDADELSQTLEDEGVDPDAARRLAERLAEENLDREAREQARRQREALNDALRRTAEDLDPTPPDQPREDTPPPDVGDDQDRPEQSTSEQREGARQDNTGEQREGTQQDNTGEQREGTQQDNTGEQREGTQQDNTGEQREGTQQDNTGEQREGTQQDNTGEQREGAQQDNSGEQREGTQQDNTGEQRDGAQQDNTGEQREGAQQDNTGEQREGAQQDNTGEQREGAQQDNTGEQREGVQQDPSGEQRESMQQDPSGEQREGMQQDPSGEQREGMQQDPSGEQREGMQQDGQRDGAGSLSEQLQRMADQQDQARRQAQDADELRRRAQEILDNATPEERRRLEELARQLADAKQEAPTSPEPLETEFFDARSSAEPDEQAPEQVIAQWYNEDAPPGERVGRADVAERMKEAAAGAERAIEQQRVPRRHRDLLRRVMRRYAGEAEPAPIVEDAKDAGDP